jgi:DNA-directed RNA polymerase subunit beta'
MALLEPRQLIDRLAAVRRLEVQAAHMAETVYDRINDYGAVKDDPGVAQRHPQRGRSARSRSPRRSTTAPTAPEKDGLFCERIFGPERDYECACGKYKGTKYKGIICDRCGVKVTHSRVRRKRMGHINLAAPVVHIWFFKAMPSRLGNLLGMKTSDLEKVIYFQDYVVVDPGDTAHLQAGADRGRVPRRPREVRQRLPGRMGAEAVRELLVGLDLDEIVAEELREELSKRRAASRRSRISSKRLKIVEALRHSDNDPAWMVMDVIPVIPPDLRPLVLLESGNFATSDLNDLYRRIINRNNRLKKLMDLNAPEVIIRNEKRMLQQAVDALFDNGRCRRPVLGSSNRPLKSLTDMIKGKQGRFRENLLGKRVDYSARSVIVVGPELKLTSAACPRRSPSSCTSRSSSASSRSTASPTRSRAPSGCSSARRGGLGHPRRGDHQHPVLLNRAPTLHRMGIQAFEPVLVEGNAIRLHPLVCGGFNADFDGDQMAVHLPLSVEAQAEAHVLMLATNNIFSPANGADHVASQDIVLGVYFITVCRQTLTKIDEKDRAPRFKDRHEALLAYDHGQDRHPRAHRGADRRHPRSSPIRRKVPSRCPRTGGW